MFRADHSRQGSRDDIHARQWSELKQRGQLEHGRENRNRKKQLISLKMCIECQRTCTSHFHLLLQKQKMKKKLRRSKSLLSNKQKTTAHSLLSILSAHILGYLQMPKLPQLLPHTGNYRHCVALSLSFYFSVSVWLSCVALLLPAWLQLGLLQLPIIADALTEKVKES